MFGTAGVIVLLLWLAELGAASWIAEHKGRGQWTWVLATFVFGPIAFLVLLALSTAATARLRHTP
jgi:hypothetical protein